MATTASGFDSRGSASRQRRFDYSIFDAGLFSQVEVAKTWDANRDAGGVGGTVALQTLRPFDRSGNVALVSVQERAGANSPGVLPQVTAEISRRNAQWGVLIAGSWSRNRVTEYGYRNWDWMPVTFGEANVGAGVSDDLRARLTGASGDPLYMARAQTYSTWTNRFERLNLVGSVQHEADNGFAFTLDGVHARLSNARNEYSLAAAGTNGLTGDVTGTQVINALTVSGNTITSADMSGVDMRTEHKVTRDHTDYSEAVAAMTLPLGSRMRLEMRAGYSVSDFEEPVADKVFLQSRGQDFVYSATGETPRNSYGFDTSDVANWSLMRADTREDSIVNRNLTARFELVRDLGNDLTLHAGGIYRRFANDGWERRVQTDYENTADAALGVGEVFSGRTYAPYVVGNVDATFAATGQARDLTANDDLPGTDYRIRENTYAGFALLAWSGFLGERPLTARLGLQFQRTAIASTGTASDSLSLFDVSNHTRHSAWLPSLDARLELRRDLIVRLAASRNVNMPDVADLRAAATIDSTPFGGTVTTGNPALRPFTSDALDLAVERYLGREGYVSLGVFFKRLDSFITSETQVMRYADTGYPLAFLYPGLTGSATYNVVRPINGSGATIIGIEAAFQHDLRFLPGPLERLGVQANLTYANGSTDVIYGSQAVELPLIDLSRWAGNTTLYYTGRGWDARLAAAYRGTYRVDVGDNGNIGEWIKAAVTLDFAAHAGLGSGMQATFELRNITDAPVIQYTDRTAKRLLVDTRSGRTIAVGLRYRY
ncbi:TonB-dependent receptor [Novosphingobium sp. 9]|uniref:TonB-dependent receptor n=1 Tax=Novosphingobium sp. 9 TaxID=2025349 RepID=UPI0021B58DA8|nr:TonB-dependent receptor [Novosphingobium sp. 9]